MGPSSSRGYRRAAALALALWAVFAAGCATTPAGVSHRDPIEPFNREVYSVNDALDKHVMKPIADTYMRITPKPVQNSIANFYDNVTYPNVMLNEFLQGKIKLGFSDVGRFVVNSTVGIAGLFDPATHMGLIYHNEDLGQTLAVWGVPQGAYLVLPLAGPDTVRNSPDLVVSTFANLIFYIVNPYVSIPLAVLEVVDYRARASTAVSLVQQAALDPYVFVREGYLQRREYLIYDGHPPIHYEDFDDTDEDEPAGEPPQPDKSPPDKAQQPAAGAPPQ
jgi:phospholipid-binding lipoprotein MlaA